MQGQVNEAGWGNLEKGKKVQFVEGGAEQSVHQSGIAGESEPCPATLVSHPPVF